MHVPPLRLKQERAPKPAPARAERAPIASVLVDSGLLHIDQEFEFLIPRELDDVITPGILVKVPFNRKRVLGLVINRYEKATHGGELRFISEAVKNFPVITPEILALAKEVSAYYGGNRWDVIRFALPTFTKKSSMNDLPKLVDKATSSSTGSGITSTEEMASHYPNGFWQALETMANVPTPLRAYWFAPPATHPFLFLAEVIERGRHPALIILPDATDVRRLIDFLSERGKIAKDQIIEWSSELSRAAREQNFLRVLNGNYQLVVGVRGALLLPITNLTLIVVWDEASESFEEQRAPYFHARELAIMRSRLNRAHLILGGAAPSVTAASYIKQGYLTPLRAKTEVLQERAPKVLAITNEMAPREQGFLPTIAWQVLKKGLESGPVLVQVPQRGYIRALSCQRCRNVALCHCGGRLIGLREGSSPVCSLCASMNENWRCGFCSSSDLRQNRVGDERVAQMLGKSFPNRTILLANAEQRFATIDQEPQIVVSTPGSEPVVAGGYHAGLILNSSMMLERATLRAEEQARRNWFGLGTLLAPRATIFIDASALNRNIHALIRWDALSISLVELDERAPLQLPPLCKAIEVSGTSNAVSEVIRDLPANYHRSQPSKINGSAEVATIVRIVGPERSKAVNEIFRRVRNQSARGAAIARIKVDPASI